MSLVCGDGEEGDPIRTIREAMVRCGRMAGLEIVRILSEAIRACNDRHGLPTALRFTPNDTRDHVRPPLMRRGPYMDGMREAVKWHHPAYPVCDEEGRLVGTAGRTSRPAGAVAAGSQVVFFIRFLLILKRSHRHPLELHSGQALSERRAWRSERKVKVLTRRSLLMT